MRKVAIVFVLAVIVPSLVLACLAVRSLRDQQFVLERQQSLLYQNVADNLAKEAQTLLAEELRSFGLAVEAILLRQDPAEVAVSFDERVRTNWAFAEVGFAVTTNGALLSPKTIAPAPARDFLACNGRFLANLESAEVYWNVGNVSKFANNQIQVQEPAQQENAAKFDGWLNSSEANLKKVTSGNKGAQTRNVIPQQSAQLLRPNEPGNNLQLGDNNYSRLNPSEAEFRQLIGEAMEGTVARIVDNRLAVLFWYRAARAPHLVFGAQVSLAKLKEDLQSVTEDLQPPLNQEFCVAVLDDNARPVSLSHRGFQTNWKRPFAATEIGEELPHWEVALYLLHPERITQAARTARLTLGLVIAALVLAIGVGSWLIVNDLRRELLLARQKTDFVSNVSHELKTPLTSIRMFSELLAEGRVNDPAKQRSYLHIITAETARLTRLINNVLDFSRMERGEKKYHFQDCDLAVLVRDTAATYRPHLENNGFTLATQLPSTPLPVRGDADAIAQVIVNLLSNAEKYSNHDKAIEIHARRRDAPLPHAEVTVLDRGPGVPRGCEEKIFEKFYRAHDSLSSGVQGSGLGLTLARQIARAHGGDVTYEQRQGGGSCFILRLPLKADETRKEI